MRYTLPKAVKENGSVYYLCRGIIKRSQKVHFRWGTNTIRKGRILETLSYKFISMSSWDLVSSYIMHGKNPCPCANSCTHDHNKQTRVDGGMQIMKNWPDGTIVNDYLIHWNGPNKKRAVWQTIKKTPDSRTNFAPSVCTSLYRIDEAWCTIGALQLDSQYDPKLPGYRSTNIFSFPSTKRKPRRAMAKVKNVGLYKTKIDM